MEPTAFLNVNIFKKHYITEYNNSGSNDFCTLVILTDLILRHTIILS